MSCRDRGIMDGASVSILSDAIIFMSQLCLFYILNVSAPATLVTEVYETIPIGPQPQKWHVTQSLSEMQLFIFLDIINLNIHGIIRYADFVFTEVVSINVCRLMAGYICGFFNMC